MQELRIEDIREAYEIIRKYQPISPLLKSSKLNSLDREVYFKMESLNPLAHSFKIRGAINKISNLTQDEKRRGVIAISSGNHGVAVSLAAKLMGVKTPIIIVPKDTPQKKLDLIESLGGEVKKLGKNYDEAHRLGKAYVSLNDKVEIDAYFEDKYIFAGQGSIGVELLESRKDIDLVLVPIGGGGLIGGIATAIKLTNPKVRVVGVQTTACPAMISSIRDGVCYEEYKSEPSICKALVGGVGRRGYEICKKFVDEILLVKEEEIRKAFYHMIMEEKLIVEPSSATTVAAVMFHKERLEGKNIACIITGGNVDASMICEIIN